MANAHFGQNGKRLHFRLTHTEKKRKGKEGKKPFLAHFSNARSSERYMRTSDEYVYWPDWDIVLWILKKKFIRSCSTPRVSF